MMKDRLELAFGYEQMDYTLFERERRQWAKRTFDGVTWADFDQNGRLVFAKEGKIFAFPDERVGELDVDLLLDLNDRKPTKLIAPPSARVR
jgi:hypothetical protein